MPNNVVSISAKISNRTLNELKLSRERDDSNCCSSFATRGNILDLAIGVVIGTAFTTVVQSLVDDIITPPLGLILGGVDFVNLTIKMQNFVYKEQPPVVIRYGKFIQAIITLIIVAFALFFVMKAANKLYRIAASKKEKKQVEIAMEITEEVKVLREIRDLLAQQSSAPSVGF